MSSRSRKQTVLLFLLRLLVIGLPSFLILGSLSVSTRTTRTDPRTEPGAHAGPWQRIRIDEGVDGAHNLVAADIDGDGDLDMAYAAFRADEAGWYENTGNPWDSDGWVKHPVDSRVGDSEYGAHYVLVRDLDLDGALDLVVPSGSGHTVVWYEAPPDPRDVSAWTKHTVAEGEDPSCPYSVEVDDLDGDTLPDIVSADKFTHRLTLHRNRAQEGWEEEVVDDFLPGAFYVRSLDADLDGTPDLVASGAESYEVSLYRRTPLADGAALWRKDTLWFAARSSLLDFFLDHLPHPRELRRLLRSQRPGPLAVGDLDGDGDPDIVFALQGEGQVRYLENPFPDDPGEPAAWRTRLVGFVGCPREVSVGDVDQDGDLDIAAVGTEDNSVYWFENGERVEQGWPRRLIDRTDPLGYLDWAHSIQLIDVDLDGDLDAVVAAAFRDRRGGTFQWYANPGRHAGAEP